MENNLWKKLLAAKFPGDTWLPDESDWRTYYETLFDEVAKRQPKRACEIGVRAGYSALTICLAAPGVHMLGIDADFDEREENTHGGMRGLWRHAVKIMKRHDFHLLIADSHHLRLLPKFDLIYVDGDHTYEGCLADLWLCSHSTDVILADDYQSIAGVRAAIDEFSAKGGFFLKAIDNKFTGLAVLERYNPERTAT